MRAHLIGLWMMGCLIGAQAGCGGSGAADVGDVATGDVGSDLDAAGPDGVADADAQAEVDTAEVDTGPPALEVPALSAATTRPDASVLPASQQGCATIRQSRCEDGTRHECALWDAGTGDWATDVPPMTEQAFVFDRYYDLYHELEGQAVDIDFTRAVPPGTPESEWGQPEVFRKMNAYGDASGWTGTAVLAAAGRYRATGTEADYERMLAKLEAMLFMYEVTDIPGMIARSHWAMLPEGAPDPVGHWDKAIGHAYPEDGTDWHYHYPISAENLARLPGYYTEGVDIDGTDYATTGRWQGDASRDMYVRSMPGVMMAYDLLGEGAREDAARAVMKRELPCTLNRMKKARIHGLQSAPDILEALTNVLGGAQLTLDEGDVDFASLDEIIIYVMEQPNPAHLELFDPTCPAGAPTEVDPALDFDAADDAFVLEVAGFLARMERSAKAPIAWPMAVSVRASDLIHMLQWALGAHYLTGEQQYLDFVGQLMEELDVAGVLGTYGAFALPIWCQSHYAPSLVYPSLYNLLARIDRQQYPAFWQMLSTVAREEGREKEMAGRDDAFWGVMYGRMVDETTDPTAQAYVQAHVEVLKGYGMNTKDKLEPDRNYCRDWTGDPGTPTAEVSEAERAICEQPVTFLGVVLEAAGLNDEEPRAVDALPLHKRVGGGFLWTSDPWRVKRVYGGSEYTWQYPMLGMTAPYWLGRADGVITEGAGLGLAWRDTGEACP